MEPQTATLGDLDGMIFCAGLGTRFKPWTDSHPKALAQVNGKSLLQRNLEYLQQYGIVDVIINVHHFASQVVEAIKENKGWGSKIRISDETGELLETGGGLLKAKPLFKPGKTFITCNADILTDIDLAKMYHYHREKNALITLAVSNRKTSRNLLFDASDRLCGWVNRKTGEEKISVPMPTYRANAYDGVAMFNYGVFDLIPFTGKFSLIDLYLALCRSHPVLAYHHEGSKWLDVGKPESLEAALKMFPD